MTHIPKVLLFGRPNVGKSTLFNRLIKKTSAIVYDEPGVTRDRKENIAEFFDLTFTAIDAPGFEMQLDTDMLKNMRFQLEQGLTEANVVLFLLDVKEGLHPHDIIAAKWLRKNFGTKQIIIVANKAENSNSHVYAHEFLKLGFGEATLISAEHNLGIQELYHILKKYIPQNNEDIEEEKDSEFSQQRIDVAILGRPNVGKSTLFNALLGQQRSITGDQPGLTRDSVTYEIDFGQHLFRFVDTAGLRRQSRIIEDLEQLSVKDTLRSIKYCQIGLIIIDALSPLDKQDLLIGQHLIQEGRGIVIIINKWDKVSEENRQSFLKEFTYKMNRTWPQIKDACILTISAIKNPPHNKIFQAIVKTFECWDRRISTGKLNAFLEDVVTAHPPPLDKGRSINIKYITQVKKRPPTFALFLSKPSQIPDSYIQYLSNKLHETFDLQGVPIRILLRSGKNPYVKRNSDQKK